MPTSSSVSLFGNELRAIACANWQGYEHWCESEEGLLSSDRVRQLGEQANRLGGYRCMAESMHHAFLDERHVPYDEICAAAMSEINFRWNGIGDWQA